MYHIDTPPPDFLQTGDLISHCNILRTISVETKKQKTRGPIGPGYCSPESLSGGEDVYHKI